MYLSIWSLCNFLFNLLCNFCFQVLCAFQILKFVVHEINFEMVKSGMMVLTGREKANVADGDVAVS
jgi:hypothetical protein